jgi:hypothetical protein
MNSRLKDKTGVFSRLGTFWSNNTSKTSTQGIDLIRSLSRLVDEDGARGNQQRTESWLMRAPATRYNFTLNIHHDEVIPIPAVSGEVYLDENNKFRYSIDDVLVPTDIDWDEGESMHYLWRVDPSIKLVCIQTTTQTLVNGVSFSRGLGWVRFFDSPIRMFPDRKIHVRAADIQDDPCHDYVLRVDPVNNGYVYLPLYYRNSHSSKALELALNEIAGRVIISEDCIIVEVQNLSYINKWVYTTDSGKVYVVDYSHTPISVGSLCYKDQIIGRAVEVYSRPSSNSGNWWSPHFSTTSRGLTLNLTDLNSALPDVKVQNANTTFTAYAAVGGTFHVKATLQGDSGDQNTYFNIVKQAELWTGIYWNDVLGFTTLNESDNAINALDFYFDNVLSSKALIIDIDATLLGASMANKVAHVARRELPIGCVPVVRIWNS